MFQRDDEREMWMGVGYLLGAIRFRVSVGKSPTSKAGYRVRCRIDWASPKPPAYAVPCIQNILGLASIEYQPHWRDSESMMRFVALIELLDKEYKIRYAFADQSGLHMFMWVFDNPPPYKYEEFIDWAEAFDIEAECLEINKS